MIPEKVQKGRELFFQEKEMNEEELSCFMAFLQYCYQAGDFNYNN